MSADIETRNDGRFRVYVLRLKDKSLYVGSTAHSIQQRIEQHQDGIGRPAKHRKRVGVKSSYGTRPAGEQSERRLAKRPREHYEAGPEMPAHLRAGPSPTNDISEPHPTTIAWRSDEAA